MKLTFPVHNLYRSSRHVRWSVDTGEEGMIRKHTVGFPVLNPILGALNDIGHLVYRPTSQ